MKVALGYWGHLRRLFHGHIRTFSTSELMMIRLISPLFWDYSPTECESAIAALHRWTDARASMRLSAIGEQAGCSCYVCDKWEACPTSERMKGHAFLLIGYAASCNVRKTKRACCSEYVCSIGRDAGILSWSFRKEVREKQRCMWIKEVAGVLVAGHVT